MNGQNAALPAALRSAGHKARAPRNPITLSDAERHARMWAEIARKEAYDADAPAYVYCIVENPGNTITVNGHEWHGPVKIGWSVDPDVRVGGLQHGNPRQLGVLGTITTTVGEVEALERSLHSKYLTQNILGEWFCPTPELLSEFGL